MYPLKMTFLLLMLSLCSILVASEKTTELDYTSQSTMEIVVPEKLTQFVNAAISDHPRLLQARAVLDSARAELRAADQALYNPEIEIDSEQTTITTSYFQLSQTIDLFDKQGARTDVSQAALIQAEAEFEIATQQLVYDFLSALAEHHTRREIHDLVNQNLTLMKDFSIISEQRHQAGDVSQVELNLARLAYSEAIMIEAQAAASYRSSTEHLRSLLGFKPNNIPELPTNLPIAELPSDETNFILSLPAVRVSQAQVNQARKIVALRQAEKSWDPTISIRGGSEDTEDLTGISLSIPLNIRNSFSAEVQVAKKQLLETEYRAQVFFREQRAKVRSMQQRYLLLQQAWNKWTHTGQTSIQQQLKLIKTLWKLGDMSTTDYLVQLKQTIDTQAAGLELRAEHWQSAFDWFNTTARIVDWLKVNKNIVELSK